MEICRHVRKSCGVSIGKLENLPHVIPLLVETYLLLFLIIDIIILSLISLLFRCGYKNKIADFCIIALDGYSIPSSIYSYRQDSLYPMHFTLVKVDIFSILCRGRFQCLNKLKKIFIYCTSNL